LGSAGVEDCCFGSNIAR